MTEQACCTLCGAAGHRAAQCNWNAPGALESIRLPAHGTTIALDEMLAGYLPDDREDVREVIEAYADIQARKAVMLFSGAGLVGRQSDACDWLENLEGDAWADACEEIAGAVKRQAEGAQGERDAAITKFAETCPMTAESAAGGKPYDIELRRYYLLGWDDRAALAQPSPAPESAAVLPPFAEKVLAKLRRFEECASDFDSGGVDIGRHWLDLLTQLGLLNRVQRSPALWEISQQGEDLLEAPGAQAGRVPAGFTLVPEHDGVDAIVTALYRRFKEWSARGFGPEDVTWCEVKADLLALIAAAPAKGGE